MRWEASLPHAAVDAAAPASVWSGAALSSDHAATSLAYGAHRGSSGFRQTPQDPYRAGRLVMAGRRIAGPGVAASCYFRTSTTAPERKALVQVTERCNLHCAHCFVSARREGIDIPLEQIEKVVLP